MNHRSSETNGTPKSTTLIRRAAYYFFLASGILALIYATYVVADAHTYQALESARFENVSLNRSEGLHDVAQGGVIGELEVPRLGLKAMFVEGDSAKILRRAVGHIPETALPGKWGNVVLTGHRDSFFRPLRKIQSGDVLTLKTPGGVFQYEVRSTAVVPPSDVEVLEPSSDRTLTLITCFPFYYVGPAPNRFIVRLRQVGFLPE